MRADDAKLLKAVGRRIAELRGGLGWNQEEFAERYGVTIKYIQALELGAENLTLTSLAKIARILGIPVPDILVAPKSMVAKRGRPAKRGPSEGAASPVKPHAARGKTSSTRARSGR